MPDLGGRFDTVLDCGLFDSLDDAERRTFAAGWAIEAIELVVLDLTVDPAGARGWQVAATRRVIR